MKRAFRFDRFFGVVGSRTGLYQTGLTERQAGVDELVVPGKSETAGRQIHTIEMLSDGIRDNFHSRMQL